MKQRGFTLLEMLLALAIFALISLAGYQVLQGSLRAQQQSQQHDRQLNTLIRLFTLMEQDIAHALISQNDVVTSQPGFLAQQDNVMLQFTRRNWLNPLNHARASLQEVQWRYAAGTLTRTRLDDGVSQAFTGVQRVDLRFFYNGVWLARWPHPYSLPQAIEVTLHTHGRGAVSRVFLPGETT
ncbi:TPA: type II secretion system minor pseudopilin GspJ [Enterobacter kobei]|nr:type II secretion system minor pseudopilin GspJ [Enterobacter kobei]HDT4959022.1 type II secretion system minor pseudopilin GspJ [Enterobacter kobei]